MAPNELNLPEGDGDHDSSNPFDFLDESYMPPEMSRAASLIMPDLPPDLSHDNSFVRELAESFGMGGDVGVPAVCAPHSPLRPQCAAPASAAAIVSGCSCSGCATAAQVTMSPPWGSYCLEIESHSVHAREQGPEGAPKYLVSNLKFYNVKVVLKDRRSQLLATRLSSLTFCGGRGGRRGRLSSVSYATRVFARERVRVRASSRARA